MSAESPPTPRKLDLKRDSRLRIEWADGFESTYPLGFLRQMCPCAACRTARTGTDPHQLLQPQASEVTGEGGASRERPRSLNLRVVPRELTSAADPVHVTDAQLVGNYAIQLIFSDGHTSGIYSFIYLREIAS
jgi:DUF971 family protein